MRRIASGLIAGIVLAGAVAAPAAAAASAAAPAGARADIGPANPLRRVLLNALRPRVEADVGQPVQFVVGRLRTQGDWAFLRGAVHTPAGRAIDFSRTRYAEQLREGMFDGPNIVALLRRVRGTWRVTTFTIGATDVTEAGWPSEYGAPASLVE